MFSRPRHRTRKKLAVTFIFVHHRQQHPVVFLVGTSVPQNLGCSPVFSWPPLGVRQHLSATSMLGHRFHPRGRCSTSPEKLNSCMLYPAILDHRPSFRETTVIVRPGVHIQDRVATTITLPSTVQITSTVLTTKGITSICLFGTAGRPCTPAISTTQIYIPCI